MGKKRFIMYILLILLISTIFAFFVIRFAGEKNEADNLDSGSVYEQGRELNPSKDGEDISSQEDSGEEDTVVIQVVD